MNQAIHQVDVLLWLTGGISEVFGYWQLGRCIRSSPRMLYGNSEVFVGRHWSNSGLDRFLAGYRARRNPRHQGHAVLSGDKLTTWTSKMIRANRRQ